MTPRTMAKPPTIELPVEAHDLRSGARLLVSQRAGAPITALQMHVKGGISLDPAGREGCAWLTGGLLDQGTQERSEAELADLMERKGISVAGDSNGVSASVASTDWKRLVDLVAELVTRPTYPTREFKRQRQRLLDRLLLEQDDPRVRGDHLFRKLVYGEHWLGRPAYGNLESVARLRASDVRSFHRNNWVPERALFSVCGDVDPEALRRRLERGLAGWRPGKPLATREFDGPAIGVRSACFESERAQVHLFVGHRGIRRRHPDYPALVVMDHVLGTGPGFTNRISRRLRDELGLAYTVHASIHHNAGVHPGTFTAYIGTSPERVETALDGFLREIRRIQDELVGAQELSVAKDYVVGSFALSFQRASRRAGYMISRERHGLPEDNLERLPRALAAVTAADVRRVAREHLFPGKVCVAAAGPMKSTELQRMVTRVLGKRRR